jgi:hypothetical protein
MLVASATIFNDEFECEHASAIRSSTAQDFLQACRGFDDCFALIEPD